LANDWSKFANIGFLFPAEAYCDDKELEICTTGLEFESERAPLVRVWNSRGFTRSPESTK